MVRDFVITLYNKPLLRSFIDTTILSKRLSVPVDFLSNIQIVGY